MGRGVLGLGLDDVGDSEVGEADGVRLGVGHLLAELFGHEEVELLQLLLRLVLLHKKMTNLTECQNAATFNTLAGLLI